MKVILTFVSAICSLAAVATTYDWVGGKSTIWNLTDANWTTAGVQGNCAFVAGGDAIFDLNDSLSLKFGAQVRPETVSATVAANKTLTFDFTNSGNQFFSTITTIEKKGTGTVYFYRPNVNSYGTGNFPADSILDIQKGVVVISSRNKGASARRRTLSFILVRRFRLRKPVRLAILAHCRRRRFGRLGRWSSTAMQMTTPTRSRT